MFSIEDVSLEEVHVQSYKYLGVVSIRTWNGHIDYIKSNENKKPELLKHIENYLPIYCRLLFFIFYIFPLFDWADVVWRDRGNESLMSDLQVSQNKAACIILDYSYRSSASAALGKLSWVNLKIRRKMHCLIFISKCRNNLFPHRFGLRYHQDFHGYNSRSKFNICKTAAKHKWGHWMSINFVSNDWNDLNQDTVHQKLGILQSLQSLH